MSVDQPGPVAPQASVSAPRSGSGPKRPPRPTPAKTASSTTTDDAQSKSKTKTSAPNNGSSSDDATSETTVAPPRPEAPSGFAGASVAAAPAPPAAAPAAAARPGVRRARRVRRVVRRIDLWSVLKLALVVYTCIYLASLGTLALVWGVLYSSGSIEKLQSFLEDVGLENFTFYGNQMFRACAAIGAVGVMAGTVVTVLATALVNIISEMTGGIRLVVIEEDVEV